jgi:SAM-dependent methyltransferase
VSEASVAVHEPLVGDAFGQMLSTCWKVGAQPGLVHEIIERDDGFIAVADAAAYFAARADWPAAEQWGGEQVTGRVLDVGCGAGRHGVVLAEAGHEVIGVDPSLGAIAVARERGLHALPGTATELPAGIGTFDTILLLGNNLGLLQDRTNARVVLTALAAVARPGAALIGSSRDPYGLFDGDHLAYLERNVRAGRMPGQTRLRIRQGFVTTGWFPYLYVSTMELAEVVADSPWQFDTFEQDGVDYCARFVLR